MLTMQVLSSITFNLDFKTAKFLHLKIINNNTFSDALPWEASTFARFYGWGLIYSYPTA